MTEKVDAHVSVVSSGRLAPESHQFDLNAVMSKAVSLGDVAEQFSSDQKFYILQQLGYEHLESFEDLPVNATYMLEKIASLSTEEAVEIINEALDQHDGDLNLSMARLDFMKALVDYNTAGRVSTSKKRGLTEEKTEIQQTVESLDEVSTDASGTFNKADPFAIFDWDLQIKTQAGIIAFWSIYPEVRSVAQPFDDQVPCETFRVYVLGLLWTVIGSFINQFFTERMPSISLSTAVVQLCMFPCGKLLELILPAWDVKIWKWKFNLNPGPWSAKEQMLATLTYSVSGGTIYVSYNLHNLQLDKFYGVKWVDFGYQIILTLSTSFMGFGLAGIVRKFVVYPVNCLWPSILPTVALNRALCQPEKKSNISGWKISSFSFFLIVTAGSFLYFWIPNFLFTALSKFNWITWIAPNNFNLAAITGSQSGLGLNPITTFDFNIILYSSPLALPFFTTLNYYIGAVIGMFCIIGIWWTNYKWTGYLPINSNALFTRTGERYAVTSILNDEYLLDNEKYQKVGPPFYTAAQLVSYGAFFALYPFTVFYIGATNFKQLVFATKGFLKMFKLKRASTYDGYNDNFSRSMAKYKEVPEWWFTIILVISLVLAILAAKIYPSQAPVWSIFFALGINFVFLIPICIFYAQTGYSFGLNVLVELIYGYANPGNGLGLNFVKAYGYVIDGQAENYITNQKQAHYMRIPPRSLFRLQMISVFIHCLVQLGTFNLQINTIEDYCDPRQSQNFSCPLSRTFYSASILWGVIGPKKVFGGLYPVLQWCFLIGFLLVIPCVLLKKYFNRNSFVKYFHPVLVIQGFILWAPYNLSYITPGLYVSWTFMSYIKRRYEAWWAKYNYILAGGLTAGIAFSSIIIFFALQYHSKLVVWWGNTVNKQGLDYIGPARLNATLEAPEGYFGPRVGNFP
ncbi:OPT family small oligopeptide transporter [Candidozyma pseudohaemuli]|uniref:OPT family small oligopeptide transporter n=1 Tax=Candidozyma pseudohaemuli TaxID=418784 RepID=A0A2P7YNQ4_9ASCO|nr:OPT family small oligopeptide transporter [[Candida] pseudohaemulonii]PSK37589.1 OPT family small oligopeptide transporter [[Candida] pseudohaemulonii]